MRILLNWCLRGICLLCFAPLLSAQETKLFEDTITVPIPGKDMVYARNNAFQILKKQLLKQAIEDLLGTPLFEEYQSHIFRQRDISTKNYLDTVRIQQEYTVGEKFTMKLQGRIQLSILRESLRELNLVFQDDPFIPITLVTEEGVFLPKAMLSERLDLFRVKIASENRINLNSIPYEFRDQREFIEKLFTQLPSQPIIYLVEKVMNEWGDAIRELRVRIYRSTDMTQINVFGLKLNPPISIKSQEEELKRVMPGFLTLFSIKSCKRHLYEQGLESSIEVNFTGVDSPFLRSELESKILQANRNIQSYTLKSLSKDSANYRLTTKYPKAALINFFESDNRYFVFFTETTEQDHLEITAVYTVEEEISELDGWEYQVDTLTRIRKTFEVPEEEEIGEAFIPKIVEKEPNNTSRVTNFLPSATRVLGNISSRADEDIFQLQLPEEDSSSIMIDWIRVGKTSLSPQLRLYDENFNFLGNYALSGKSKRLKFSYTLPSDAPKVIFIRISDAVGFIQGETGGYKSYQYMLRFEWKN